MMEAPTILEEHEPFQKDENKAIYDPTEDEKKLVKKCEGLFQKAKRAKSKYDWNWIENYKLFRGKQWKEQRPSYRASEVVNLIWQNVQTQVPVIVDARPKFEYLPQEPSDREFADLMNDICASDWQTYNWLYKLTEVLYDSHLYGTGLSCLKYDPKKARIVYESVDPFYMFPDPSAYDFETRCAYTVVAEPMDVEKIKRIAGDKAQYIKADVVNFASEKRVDLANVKYNNPSSDQLYVEVVGGYDTTTVPEVLVKTVYMEDEEVLNEEVKDETDSTKPPIIQKRLKYPNGRKVVIANDVVLDDGQNDYEGEIRYPYQRLINYILPRCFWGISELEALESPQRTFNKLVSYVLDVLYLMGNPIWVVDFTAGVDTENLTNQPGLVVEKEPGSEVRREAGVQLQPYVLSLIDRFKEWFDQISGSQDVTRGVTSGGVTAASAIQDLQNAAQTRIRLKMKNLDAYLQDLGRQYANRVMQFYTAPQVFRLTGKDGTEKYFKMHIKKLPDGTSQAHVVRYTENGLEDPQTNVYTLRGELDVRVTTGSSLPFSKMETERRVKWLFEDGIIDAEEVLKALEYPNWEAIQQRMQAKAEAAAQAKAQAQQAQQAPAA